MRVCILNPVNLDLKNLNSQALIKTIASFSFGKNLETHNEKKWANLQCDQNNTLEYLHIVKPF